MESNKPQRRTLEGMVQLHPESCGSSIRWHVTVTATRHEYKGKVTVGREFETSVHLTDCGRQITWSASRYDGGSPVMVEKLDRAIAELKRMRAAVIKQNRYYDSLPTTKQEDD